MQLVRQVNGQQQEIEFGREENQPCDRGSWLMEQGGWSLSCYRLQYGGGNEGSLQSTEARHEADQGCVCYRMGHRCAGTRRVSKSVRCCWWRWVLLLVFER